MQIFKKMQLFRKAAALVIAVALVIFIPALTSSLNSYAASKPTLHTPDDIEWTNKYGDDDGSYARWSEVENAKEYVVVLYYANDNGSFSKLAEHKTKHTYTNFRGKMTKNAEYAFRVKALGTKAYYDSGWSELSDTVYYTAVGPADGGSSSGNAAAGYIGGAQGWHQDNNGRWYATNPIASTWYNDGWHWVDGNGDGIAECYYFKSDGYVLTDAVTPDGYTVNSDGAWVVNGNVQLKQL